MTARIVSSAGQNSNGVYDILRVKVHEVFPLMRHSPCKRNVFRDTSLMNEQVKTLWNEYA